MQSYRIVVGFDGSEGGIRALDWAVAQAARHGGTVHAVTAWHWTEPDAGVDIRADQETIARQSLDEAVTAALAPYPRVAVSAETVPGSAAGALSRASADADLLVLGSHGHSRLFHAVLGSVAEACIRQATCPVVVVPVPHAAWEEETGTVGTTATAPISTAVY
jgi:nucleotide-binding universal stress UspA family protein